MNAPRDAPKTTPASADLSVVIAHRAAGRLAAARELCDEILRNSPNDAGARHVRGVLARDAGDLSKALDLISESTALDPSNADAYSSLGVVLLEAGEVQKALNAYRTALVIDPQNSEAHRKLLAGLLYLSDITPDRRFAEHLAFAPRHQLAPEHVLPAPANDRDPDRRLRVGILSSDLWDHPIARNLLPFLRFYDRKAVEIACYAEVSRLDALSEMIRGSCATWRSTIGLSDQAVAEMIRKDKIDILVVLAARFDGNRPLVACYRPAPIQVSMFDGATTALREIDYWITDPVLTPPNTTERFVETLAQLPLLVTYAAIDDAPPVATLPAASAGRIAFGSFNNPTKIGDDTVALWALALRAVTDSRLILKYRGRYADPQLRARLRVAFGAQGINPSRISFQALPGEFASHLAAYGAVDIALDTTPFSGATTTFEALWMGVPVITLAGDTMISRMSASQLSAAGLDDLMTTSSDAFVARAVALASDIGALSARRAGLRDRVARSLLCDGPAYARSVDNLWRSLWRTWCTAS